MFDALPRPPRSLPLRARQLHRVAAVAVVAALVAAACSVAAAAHPSALVAGPIRVGAILPLTGDPGELATQEGVGIQIAADLVNADGGVDRRSIAISVANLDDRSLAQKTVDGLRAAGAVAVIGSYSSDLSIPVSQATQRDGLVYWESGAVADRLTGRGLPLVFRIGANGARLGNNSATFAATELAPRLGKSVGATRVSIVAAEDDYARSVADAALSAAVARGMAVSRIDYDLSFPDWPTVISRLEAARPDIIILAAHIPDGEAFRRAMLAAHLHVGALIGSTMAQCMTDFGADLGADAIGVFASDRPTGGFNPGALTPDARAVYDRFAAAWQAKVGGEPTEEGLSGFAAAWALFHDVLPATGPGSLDPAGIAAAARSMDLPDGSLPNGAGLHFSSDPARLGQNDRAAAVIWQWQAVRTSVVVWPSQFASGTIRDVPLPP